MLEIEKKAIKAQFDKFCKDHYGKPSDTLKIWEFRESLSFFHLTSEFIVSIHEINQIVKNILKKKTKYSWRKLTIYEEALVQHQLRNHGYEITCCDLNVFPQSVIDMQPLLIKTGHAQKIKYVSFDAVHLLEKYRYMIGSAIILLSLLMIGLPWQSLAFTYVICAVLASLGHDYALHNTKLVIKNKVFYWLSAVIVYMYAPQLEISSARKQHGMHHAEWSNDRDPTTLAIKKNWFTYIFGCNFLPINYNIQEQYEQEIIFNSTLLKYRNKILIAISVVFILIFGYANFIWYYLIPVVSAQVFYSGLPDVVYHYYFNGRENEKDIPWMMPLWFSTAYHISHHKRPNELFFGSRWVKYFNLQYWITLLLYDTSRSKIN